MGEIDSLIAPAGAGFAATLEVLERARERLKLLASLSPEPGIVRYVGGIAFDPRTWRQCRMASGEAARFVLPRVIARQQGRRAELTVLGTPEAEARRLIARIEKAASEACGPAEPIRVTEAHSPASRERWTGAVREVLRAIESGAVRKVVLSRDIVLDAGHPIDPWQLLRLIHGRDPYGLRFCFSFDGDSAFVGASPERLVAQRGTAIACDCLAGTIARGRTPEAQERNAAALLASEKDGREHRIVLEEILVAIEPHARSCESPPRRASCRSPRCCTSGARSARRCAKGSACAS